MMGVKQLTMLRVGVEGMGMEMVESQQVGMTTWLCHCHREDNPSYQHKEKN